MGRDQGPALRSGTGKRVVANPPARAASHWDAGETLAERFRAHARDAEHLYGYAIRGMADDWDAGGPVRELCRGYEHAPRGAVVHLRLLAGVFRLVLTGRAPELVRFYPCLGGTAPASQVWPVMRDVSARTSRRCMLPLRYPRRPTRSVDRLRCSLDCLIWSLPRAYAVSGC